MIIKFNHGQFTKVYAAALVDLMIVGRGELIDGRSYDLHPCDVLRWASSADVDSETALGVVALGLAMDFNCEILTYGFAYLRTNELQHMVWHSGELQGSRLLDDLFLAFDASDFGANALECEALARKSVESLLAKVWLPRWSTDQVQ